MASLRNSMKRVTHKERAQPAHRKRFGLLEKHSDYKERANDFSFKKKRIDAMKQKAALRNPDEFYKRMTRTATKGGIHSIDYQGLDADTVKAIHSLDSRYLMVERAKEDKRIEKLRANLHFVDASRGNKHVVFVDDVETAKTKSKAEIFDTLPETVDRTHNRPRRSAVAEAPMEGSRRSRKEQVKLDRLKSKAYDELERRLDRRDKMDLALRHLDAKKNQTGKGRKYKEKDAEEGRPAVYKWKQQRKR